MENESSLPQENCVGNSHLAYSHDTLGVVQVLQSSGYFLSSFYFCQWTHNMLSKEI